MKHARVIIDYEPRLAAQDARIAALEADCVALQAAALELLARLQRAERTSDIFRGAIMVRARERAGELQRRGEK